MDYYYYYYYYYSSIGLYFVLQNCKDDFILKSYKSGYSLKIIPKKKDWGDRKQKGVFSELCVKKKENKSLNKLVGIWKSQSNLSWRAF